MRIKLRTPEDTLLRRMRHAIWITIDLLKQYQQIENDYHGAKAA